MDLREFRYLIVLSEEGSLSKAADRLYMAQSSLSQFLSQTEEELGVKLFTRTARGIRPTRSGEVFIEKLHRIEGEYERAKSELWDSENLKGGQVTIGLSSFRSLRVLPEVLRRFSELYPNVKVDVQESNSMQLEELLLKGLLDIAVVALPLSKMKRDVTPLTKDEILLAVPKGHPVSEISHESGNGPRWVNLEDTAQYPYITSSHDTILGRTIRDLFHKTESSFHILYDRLSAEMTLSMVRRGLGLTITYASAVEPGDPIDTYRIGQEGEFIELGIAYPPHEYRSKAAQEMEKVIRQIYKEKL